MVSPFLLNYYLNHQIKFKVFNLRILRREANVFFKTQGALVLIMGFCLLGSIFVPKLAQAAYCKSIEQHTSQKETSIITMKFSVNSNNVIFS